MDGSEVDEDEEAGTNLVGVTLKSILNIGGRAAAQEWGMKVMENKSAEEIRESSVYWPPEVLELMAEKLKDDERFS